MRTVLIVCLAAVLAGCGGLPVASVPKEVKVAILSPCVKPEDRPVRPPFRSDAELEGMADYHFVLALDAERIKALDFIRLLEAVVEGCARIPALPAPGIHGP